MRPIAASALWLSICLLIPALTLGQSPALTIERDTSAGYGTANPYSLGSGGPFYGDVLRFRTLFAGTATPVRIEFGNPEASAGNTLDTMTGQAFSYQYSGLHSELKIRQTRTVTATDVSDPSRTASVPVSMRVPVSRIRLLHSDGTLGSQVSWNPPIISPAPPPPVFLLGDSFVDASDGSLESHYSVWTLDGAPGAKARPDQPFGAGPCGVHVVSFSATYGAYDGSFASRTIPDYQTAAIGAEYEIRPFIGWIGVAASDATGTRFRAETQAGAGPGAAAASFQWELLSSSGAPVLTSSSTATLTSQPEFVVPRSSISPGSRVRLTVTLLDPTAFGEACASRSSSVAVLDLRVPDPALAVSGCTTVGGSCSIVASSATGQDDSAWIYEWSLNGVQKTHGGKTYTPASADISQPGAYRVTVLARNGSGVGTAEQTFELQPAGCSTKPGILSFTWGGVDGSCSGGTCTAAHTLQFTPSAWAYTFQDCDRFTWDFGDGTTSTTKSPLKKFAGGGVYTVTLVVANDAGSETVSQVIQLDVPPPSCNPPTGIAIISYLGSSSGCAPGSVASCAPGELIQLTAGRWQGTLQECDRFEWDFGDGSPVSARTSPTINHIFAGDLLTYTVRLSVWNSAGSLAPVSETIRFGIPDTPPPTNVGFSAAPEVKIVGVPVTFSATAEAPPAFPVTRWQWDFGDGEVATGNPIQHRFSRDATFYVTVSASNSHGTTSVTKSVVVIKPRSYLLPVVSHVPGAKDSQWRTDLHVFNGRAAKGPVNLEFELTNAGIRKSFILVDATLVYEDFMGFFTPGDMAGPVIVRAATPDDLQIWTRTYSIAPSGVGTHGHLIPAIPLDEGAPAPGGETTLFLTGVNATEKYRTNIYLLNLTAETMPVSITAYEGDHGLAFAQLSKDVAPLQLTTVSASEVPSAPATKPFSIAIRAPSKGLLAYESVVDNGSNDPIYVPAVSSEDLQAAAMRAQVLPSVGHVGPWRSDVTIFNADDRAVQFDLSFYDTTGALVAQAKNQILPAKGLAQVDDVVTSHVLAPAVRSDAVGILRLDVTSILTDRYPLIGQRNYSDAGGGARFGQGILGFSTADANVRLGKRAVLAAVRSDAAYRTNVGLVNVGTTPALVTLTLLDPQTAQPIGMYSLTLGPNESKILPEMIRFLNPSVERASISVEVANESMVWAFASIIDRRTNDPEYVPAIPLD